MYRPQLDWLHDGRSIEHWAIAAWNRADESVVSQGAAMVELAKVRDQIVAAPDFRGHEMVWIAPYIGPDDSATVFVVVIHSTVRGGAQGGTRFCQYESMAEVLSDSLRLSEGMTRKCALAGLWWGGGKSVIARTSNMTTAYEADGPHRQHLFSKFGEFVSQLGGVYYAAEDMGTVTADMDCILASSRFVTCIDRKKGGSGNPSPFTAQAVYLGLATSIKILEP
ncbi:MAG: Glu/Leu/Phe/Val dehydrogenase dimerization domain-containing protein, partial [Vicinamibacterales bacterium]